MEARARRKLEESIERMTKTLDVSEWIRLRQGREYVSLGNGEVELEERINESEEEDGQRDS